MTFSTAAVDVDGIQVLAQREYTSSTAKEIYEANMQVLRDFLSATTPPGSSPITDQQLQTAIKNLRDLAINGVLGPVDQSNPGGEQKVYYLTVEMNQALDLLFRTLNVAGVKIPKTGEIDVSGSPTASWYQLWYDLGAATPLIQNALSVALSAGENNYSLQSMVELLYVKRANDQLGDKMGDLQEALQVTKDALSLLTNLQDLHNKIQVNNKPPFSTFFNIFTHGIGNFSPDYQTAASAYFAMPIVPTLIDDGYTIGGAEGFMYYLFNPSKGAIPNSAPGGNYKITLTAETIDLVPQAFIDRYGLKLDPSDPSGLTYVTQNAINPTGATNFIKEYKFFSGQYTGVPGPDIAPGQPRFDQFYNISFTSGFTPGASFAGTTVPGGQGLYTGGGTNNLANVLSGILQLTRDGDGGVLGEIKNLVKYKNDLISEISALNISNPAGIGDPNSLQGRLKATLDDINAVFKTAGGDPITSSTPLADAYSGFSKWMLDNYGSTGIGSNTAGEIQQNITNAITAGQSLNDTQKESVRQFLFIFEEFYKSASAILQSLTQIVERIAQALGRG
jgi:hypothetical protein